MSNGGAHSHVTQVDLDKSNNLVLTVQFDGFTANEPVEISGYVVQSDGAYSAFYLETTVPSWPSQASGTVQVPVTINSVAGMRTTDKVMVVTKVAKVWPTVLTAVPSGNLGTNPDIAASWTAVAPPPWLANW